MGYKEKNIVENSKRSMNEYWNATGWCYLALTSDAIKLLFLARTKKKYYRLSFKSFFLLPFTSITPHLLRSQVLVDIVLCLNLPFPRHAWHDDHLYVALPLCVYSSWPNFEQGNLHNYSMIWNFACWSLYLDWQWCRDLQIGPFLLLSHLFSFLGIFSWVEDDLLLYHVQDFCQNVPS